MKLKTLYELLGVTIGASFGVVGWIIGANLEDWQFHTIRSWITGETVMSEIIQHPADIWVCYTIFGLCILFGGFGGVVLARRIARYVGAT